MNESDLRQIISQPESRLLERKSEGINNKDLRKTICAFANSVNHGETAILLIGISDSGGILGVSDTDKKQIAIRQVCENQCYPPIENYEITVSKLEEKDIILVKVEESTTKPHFTGASYVRQGSQSIDATKDQLDELIASRNEKSRRIQSMKNDVITVHYIGRKPGDERPVGNRYRAHLEARITGCDAHKANFTDIPTGKIYNEPIENIQISFDNQEHRDMLIIR